MNTLFPIVLCGGSGTRLWPLSRTALPKQFIALGDGATLFENTLTRVSALSEKSIIVCNNEHRFLVGSMMTQNDIDLDKNVIFLEPVGKNTSLPIALSAMYALDNDKNATLLVLPSDHILEPLEVFVRKVQEVLPMTDKGIITFGIKPNMAHTGYGYIEQGNKLTDSVAYVQKFIEKPSLDKAKQLVEKHALWNSGMFLMRADMYLQELMEYREDIYHDAIKIWESRYQDLDFTRFDTVLFEKAHAESIDYAVMEKTNKALVCPLDIMWSDLGSFQALHEQGKKDENKNCKIGDVFTLDTSNSYVYSTNALVSVLGLDNVAVVQTKDAVMVSSLDKTQNIKEFMEVLKQNKRPERELHAVCHRPWGFYESLINSDRFQVKHITVQPKGIMSVQMHHHRSEHWIVVKGTALVNINGKEELISENQSVYIPLGEVHRLTNPGRIPLELIEVQTGSYLGEDDITRFDDAYGRGHHASPNKDVK